jgi:3,4-dihydroxy 2-butanone 4-phosphate synthase/GTP cyclohydrolase II
MSVNMSEFDSIPAALENLKAGKMVIVVDDEDRENEGDLVMAAQKVAPEAINFMTKYGRGLICVALTKERAEQLKLEPMVEDNTSKLGCKFTVSVDAMHNTTTGSSAYDRSETIQVLIDENSKPEDLVRPGHIFPIVAAPGGVLRRVGHTEAAVDLAKLAGFYPGGVLCEILSENGQMARLLELKELAQKFNLRMVTVKDLIAYRARNEKLVERITSVNFPSKFGKFKLHLYKSLVDGNHHLALEKGEVRGEEKVLVRVHSQCLTGDVLGSRRCDCGDQLAAALQMIEKEGNGVLLYMSQEGRGIGLANKILAYQLQDLGKDTVDANLELGFKPDLRDYGIGAQILSDLGLTTIRLITNNPRKIVGLEGYGLKVVERVPSVVTPTSENVNYLETKMRKLGHLIDPIHLKIK